MKPNVRHKLYGYTVAEHLKTVPDELTDDAVGMWQIVPAGRYGFELTGDDLAEFVHCSISALLERGAKPVIGGGGTDYDWILETQYGATPQEIAHSVVQEWISAGEEDPDPGGLWFALPSPHVGSAGAVPAGDHSQ